MSSRTKASTRRFGNAKSDVDCRVDKLLVYLPPAEMLAVMDAIGATTAKDLAPIHAAGTHTGRALAAICRQWLASREAK